MIPAPSAVKWYSFKNYHGKQYQSSAAVRSYAQGYKVLGRVAGAIGMGFSGVQSFQAFKAGEKAEGFKAGFDTIMGGVGTFGGPYGAGAAAVYFGIDMTVGWGAVGNSLLPPPEDCHRVRLNYSNV